MHDDLGNASLGRSLKALLDKRGSSDYGIGGEFLPVIVVEDTTRGHASGSRRWVQGVVQVTAGAGQTGRVRVQCTAPNTIAVVRPYVQTDGAGGNFIAYAVRDFASGVTRETFAADADTRFGPVSTTGIVQLLADDNVNNAVVGQERMRLHTDIQGALGDFRQWYVIDDRGAVCVSAVALAQTYWVGVTGYVVSL